MWSTWRDRHARIQSPKAEGGGGGGGLWGLQMGYDMHESGANLEAHARTRCECLRALEEGRFA
jgi:hypothetical protein